MNLVQYTEPFLLSLHAPHFNNKNIEHAFFLNNVLIKYFVSTTGENADKLLQFKRWFWSIVEKMSMTERQDLVSLLTSRLFLN